MKTITQSVMILIAFTILTGIVYPLLVTGIAQFAFPKQSNGSLIEKNGKIIGSELIGRQFTNDNYFHGRPSACNYDGTNSGGYNLGPTSRSFIHTVSDRIAGVRIENGMRNAVPVPPDMVLSSASGLDPDISVENARIQSVRIAKARNLPVETVLNLIEARKEKPFFGLWGAEKVNVLMLNLALNEIKR